jgi:hypothetical protein
MISDSSICKYFRMISDIGICESIFQDGTWSVEAINTFAKMVESKVMILTVSSLSCFNYVPLQIYTAFNSFIY